MHLNVNETFGPTIQGEGRNAGHLCSFLRLAGCNLTCSWCDTPYTWDWSRFDHNAETHPMLVDDVAATLDSMPGRIVVSGGEPLIQARALGHLLDLLPHRVFDVETNGTRSLGSTAGKWATVTTSPKVIRSAGQPALARQVHPSIIEVADFKFVVRDDDDLADVIDWLIITPAVTPDRIWLMPEGITASALTERTPFVMEACTKYGFNFTSRLHVYGWADVRGH